MFIRNPFDDVVIHLHPSGFAARVAAPPAPVPRTPEARPTSGAPGLAGWPLRWRKPARARSVQAP